MKRLSEDLILGKSSEPVRTRDDIKHAFDINAGILSMKVTDFTERTDVMNGNRGPDC